MKKILLLFVTILASGFIQAQILEPVKWSTSVVKISETEYELRATADIEPTWHLYAQNVPEDGPIATNFTFEDSDNYEKQGNMIEGEGRTVYDPVFEMKIKYFENKALFKQRIKLKSNSTFNIAATVEFMVCDDNRCLPPTEIDLMFNIQ